jgi:hypothetical protein
VERQEPIARGACTAFPFSPTRPGMLGSPLRRAQVGEGREPGEKRLWASLRMLEGLQPEPVALAGVGSWLQQGAAHRQPGGGKGYLPARLLGLPPAPPPFPMRWPCHAGARSGTVP